MSRTEFPKLGEHLVVEEHPIDLEAELEDGSLSVQVEYPDTPGNEQATEV